MTHAPPLAGDLAQVSNERRSHPLAAIRFVDREIVNVDFAPVLLKLVQLVRNKSAYNSAMRERDQRNDVFLFEQPLKLGGRRPCALGRTSIAEGGPQQVV